MRGVEPELGRRMRWLLLTCGLMNVGGAITFAPPFPANRRAIGLGEPPAIYLWVLSAWILGFGVAYFHQGLIGRANRAILTLGAWGKATFAGLLLTGAIRGDLSLTAAMAAMPDLLLAIVFAVWLWRACRGRG